MCGGRHLRSGRDEDGGSGQSEQEGEELHVSFVWCPSDRDAKRGVDVVWRFLAGSDGRVTPPLANHIQLRQKWKLTAPVRANSGSL